MSRVLFPSTAITDSPCRNDILDRFWKTGTYAKKPATSGEAEGGLEADGAKAHEEGCKETLSPAMDILVSSNFERLMWFLGKGSYLILEIHPHDLPREAHAKCQLQRHSMFLVSAISGIGAVVVPILTISRVCIDARF